MCKMEIEVGMVYVAIDGEPDYFRVTGFDSLLGVRQVLFERVDYRGASTGVAYGAREEWFHNNLKPYGSK